MIGIMEFKAIVTVRFEIETEMEMEKETGREREREGGKSDHVLAQSERAQKCQGDVPSFRFHS